LLPPIAGASRELKSRLQQGTKGQKPRAEIFFVFCSRRRLWNSAVSAWQHAAPKYGQRLAKLLFKPFSSFEISSPVWGHHGGRFPPHRLMVRRTMDTLSRL
jgi:hypothetical protein